MELPGVFTSAKSRQQWPELNPATPLAGTSTTLSVPPPATVQQQQEAESFWARKLGMGGGRDLSPDQDNGHHTKNLRRELYRLADAYRPYALAPRVAKCSHVRHSRSVELSRPPEGKARLAGLIKCRSKACAVCLARRRADYADQVKKVAELWLTGWEGVCPQPDHVHHKTGLHTPRPDILELARHRFTPAYLLTCTIRHGWDDDLKTTGHGVRKAWRALLQSRQWRDLRELYGLEYIVAEEITHGANGWHPHMHVLLLPRRRFKRAELGKVRKQLYELWASMVEQHIGWEYMPLREYGTDLRRCSKEDYISKAIGLELADPGIKRGRAKGSRTPVQLLRDFADNDDRQALALYQHYERTMRGRRDMTWSKGLREYRLVAQHELAKERELEAELAPLVAELPGDIWDDWRKMPQPHIRMLEAAEADGLQGVLKLLGDELGTWTADIVRDTTARALRARESADLEDRPQVGPPSCGPPELDQVDGSVGADALPDPRDLLELCSFEPLDPF